MDTAIFLAFAGAYVALLLWGVALIIRRRRVVVSDLAILVVLGLVYDNSVIGLGTFIGEGPVLEGLNGARYWLHAFLTPLLVLVAWDVLRRARVRWAKTVWAAAGAMVVTVALIVFEIIVGAAPAQLVAQREYGALSYANENAPDGPPLMVLIVAAALLVAGIYAWVRLRWPWLAVVTVLMIAGSAIPIPVPSAAITNAFELILLIGIMATITRQDRGTARITP